MIDQVRMAWVTTANTGDFLELRTAQGVVRLQRVDPHGVELTVNGQPFGITSSHLAIVGRFFLAAAIRQGQDINDGWDALQHRTDEGYAP